MTKYDLHTSPLFIVSGPTATGKTSIAIKLALALHSEHYKAEVVNFDSVIFYKDLNIGSAKPQFKERQGVTHHLIDIAPIEKPLNASDYVEMAEKKIKELHQQNIIPILTGGSAFYLRALIKGMYESKKATPEIKKEIDELYKKYGITPFLDYLTQHDPESLQALHINDHYRLMRAYEHHKVSGQKISAQKLIYDQHSPYDFSQGRYQDWDIWHIYLDIPKEQHWELIEKRTRKMLSNGLIQEVEKLLESGIQSNAKPLQSVGYKEILQYLNGEFKTLEECIERISISTRQLAKSQRTFFNKITPKKDYNPLLESSRVIEEAIDYIKSRPRGVA